MSDNGIFIIGAGLCAIVGFATGYIWCQMVQQRRASRRFWGEA